MNFFWRYSTLLYIRKNQEYFFFENKNILDEYKFIFTRYSTRKRKKGVWYYFIYTRTAIWQRGVYTILQKSFFFFLLFLISESHTRGPLPFHFFGWIYPAEFGAGLIYFITYKKMEAIYIRVYKKKVHPSPHIELRKKNPIKMDKKERGETSRNRIKTQPKKKIIRAVCTWWCCVAENTKIM